MSRKYRESKADLIAFYAFEGKYPSCKSTLYQYKKLKRKIQRYTKKNEKVSEKNRMEIGEASDGLVRILERTFC